MPYEKYYHKGEVPGKPYILKNISTGKILHFSTAESRDKAIKIREAFSHGWKPKGLAAASPATRRRVASIGGQSR